MNIDSYTFGSISIDGKRYTDDVILYPDGSMNKSWWRREGHSLYIDDLDRTAELRPEVIIIGTGASGMMRIRKDTLEYLHTVCQKIIVEKTGNAVKKFNEFTLSHTVAGLFHLTC